MANAEETASRLDEVLVDRLVGIALDAILVPTPDESAMLGARIFDIILESYHASGAFRTALKLHPNTKMLLSKLLLEHPSQTIRSAAKHSVLRYVKSRDPALPAPGGVNSLPNGTPRTRTCALVEFLWPILLELLAQNGSRGQQIEELLGLTQHFFSLLLETDSPILDLGAVMRVCTEILLWHNSVEVG